MASAAAGSKLRQATRTRRLYCQLAKAVPQTEALLLVPNSVAGSAVGKTAKSVGKKIKPPPPTMASTKPANPEAKVTSNISMGVDYV